MLGVDVLGSIHLVAAVIKYLSLTLLFPAAFAIGYSIFIVSIIVETTYTALRPAAADSSETSENGHG